MFFAFTSFSSMLKATCTPSRLLRRRHTFPVPYFDKMTRMPGRWGSLQGPPRDSLGLRIAIVQDRVLSGLGKLTKPFRTPRMVYIYRKLQARVFTMVVGTLMILIVLQIFTFFILMLYSAYSVSPSTPILQRKAHEHRVAKQIMTMVRKREAEIVEEISDAEAKNIVQERESKEAG